MKFVLFRGSGFLLRHIKNCPLSITDIALIEIETHSCQRLNFAVEICERIEICLPFHTHKRGFTNTISLSLFANFSVVVVVFLFTPKQRSMYMKITFGTQRVSHFVFMYAFTKLIISIEKFCMANLFGKCVYLPLKV